MISLDLFRGTLAFLVRGSPKEGRPNQSGVAHIIGAPTEEEKDEVAKRTCRDFSLLNFFTALSEWDDQVPLPDGWNVVNAPNGDALFPVIVSVFETLEQELISGLKNPREVGASYPLLASSALDKHERISDPDHAAQRVVRWIQCAQCAFCAYTAGYHSRHAAYDHCRAFARVESKYADRTSASVPIFTTIKQRRDFFQALASKVAVREPGPDQYADLWTLRESVEGVDSTLCSAIYYDLVKLFCHSVSQAPYWFTLIQLNYPIEVRMAERVDWAATAVSAARERFGYLREAITRADGDEA